MDSKIFPAEESISLSEKEVIPSIKVSIQPDVCNQMKIENL